MYFTFLWEVLKRAFTPAPRVTDMLQILAASALPAASKFIGIRLPQNAGDNALAYIGLIALSFVVIRLFWAPYSLWKEQEGQIGGLKLELSRPERLELEHMAKLRAKARMKMARVIRQFQHKYFLGEGQDMSSEMLDRQLVRLHAQVSPSSAFTTVFADFHQEMRTLEGKGVAHDDSMEDAGHHKRGLTLAYALSEWLHGRITDEALLLRWLKGTESETQP
jgi:hypothetical protein